MREWHSMRAQARGPQRGSPAGVALQLALQTTRLPMTYSGWFLVGIELSFGPLRFVLTSHKVDKHFSRAVPAGLLLR
jgi:hypothetical protein